MLFTGFLNISDIAGESRSAGHEDEIDIHGVAWQIDQKSKKRQRSGGRRAGRAVVSGIQVSKYYDASSPYIALAAMQGKSIPEATLSVRKDSGDAHLDYLVITMTNAYFSHYDMVTDEETGQIEEIAEICFERVKVLYTVQADDHSAGDEHEIEYDIAAGA